MSSPLLKMLFGWLIAMVIIGYMISVQHKHHPKALFYLFFTEMWERFSYYGLRGLLMLYMVKQLMLGDTVASEIYGAYVALAYSSMVFGGILSERFIGLKNSIIIGGLLMAAGHFGMAIETPWMLYVSLGFIALGNGFFKPNIGSLLGKFYFEKDPRRDSAFTIFYMGVNTGAFLAPLTCGFLGETYGWGWGFGIAGVGMLIGLLIFSFANSKKAFEEHGLPPNEQWAKPSIRTLVIGAIVMIAPLFAFMIKNTTLSAYAFMVLAIVAFVYLFMSAMKEKLEDQKKILAIMVLFTFTILFWTFFELAASVFTLYTDRNIDRTIVNEFLQSIFSGQVSTSEFQSINPFFIILLAPLFSKLWNKWNISTGLKFSLSLFQLGIGFLVLVWGSTLADSSGLVPLIFMVAAYFFHTTSELCLSPIGLSIVTKLSPPKIVATVMGIWWMSVSFSGILGGKIGAFSSIENTGNKIVTKAESLAIYTNTFQWIALTAIASGVLLLFFVKPLKRWMQEG
jgi:proton-dependent oligopeptide transporter, POT family